MGLINSDTILNGTSSTYRQLNGSGHTRCLEFVSAGFCDFADIPRGCIELSGNYEAPKPKLVNYPETSSSHSSSDAEDTNMPNLNGRTEKYPETRKHNRHDAAIWKLNQKITPKPEPRRGNGIDAKWKLRCSSEKSPPPSQARNGHVDTPRPTMRGPFENMTVNHRNGADVPRQNLKRSFDTTSDHYRNGTSDVSKPPLKKMSGNVEFELAAMRFTWLNMNLKMVNHASGLYNMRNDCFINSVLQFVFHTPQLMRYIVLGNHNNCTVEKCVYCVLKIYYTKIRNKIAAFDIKQMRDIVNSQFPNRIANNQEDAHEMLIFLLSKLEPPLQKRSQSSTPQIIKTTEIDRIFGGRLCYQTRCRQCKQLQSSSEQFRELNLNLNIQPQVAPTLENYIENFFKYELLNGYKCDNCKERDSVRKPAIEISPNILIMQLKRFRPNGSKNSVEVTYQVDLDLTRFSSDRSNRLVYKLYGFISHSGMTSNSGHYTATMLGYNGQWYEFDDDYVRSTNPRDGGPRQPYLLFYYKVHEQQNEHFSQRTSSGITTTGQLEQIYEPKSNGLSSFSNRSSSGNAIFTLQTRALYNNSRSTNGFNGQRSNASSSISMHRKSNEHHRSPFHTNQQSNGYSKSRTSLDVNGYGGSKRP